MDGKTRNLVLAINGLRALIHTAQGVLTDYLRPDGNDGDHALNRLLDLFDGPSQRLAEGTAQAVVAAAEAKPDIGPDIRLETVDFWFVWSKHGHLPRVTHHTEAAAVREAERLARKNPGRKFIVLRAEHKLSLPAEQKEPE
jgi:hypothetical protein